MDEYLRRKNVERAQRRARNEAAGVFTARIKSETNPKLEYILHAQNGVATCSCRGYQSYKHCKHADAFVRVLKEEQ